MRGEEEVRSRLAAEEAELRALSAEIAELSRLVSAGNDGWRAELERLAAMARRRRAVQDELASLRWVLANS